MPYTLHEFQAAAVDAGLGAIGRRRNELIVLPTGSGKSVAIAGLVERMRPSKTRRILLLSHVREILEQDAKALQEHLPDLSLGVVCAGLDRMEYGRDVTLASVQSIYRRTYLKWDYAACLVDEAHLIGREDQTMYQRVFGMVQDKIKARRGERARVPILGFTATPYRLDTGYLHKGPGAMFERIAYDVPVTQLINAGILSPLTTAPVTAVDFSTLGKRGNEYLIDQYTKGQDWLAETAECVKQIGRLAHDRKRWLIFCCTIKHADAVAHMLANMGIRAEAVHTGTRRRDRDEIVREFRAGNIRALINVNVFTTGFDAPDIDCITVLRPTLSTGLWLQMIGRGLRKAPGKADCLVLDFAGNIERHGPMTNIVPRHMEFAKRTEAVGVTRKCPTCMHPIAPMTRQCSQCGRLFAAITVRPSSASIMLPDEITPPGEAKKLHDAHMRQRPPPPDLNPDVEYLSTEEIAGVIGTTPQYVKQMRHFGTGPPFYKEGGPTSLGWRQIVYRLEDVHAWQDTLRIFEGEEGTPGEGRLWRRVIGKEYKEPKAVDINAVRKMWATHTVKEIAAKLGHTDGTIRRTAKKLGLVKT